MERGAYFVVRERNNLQARVLAEIEISLGRLAQLPCLRVASDQVIQLKRGGETILRPRAVHHRRASLSARDQSVGPDYRADHPPLRLAVASGTDLQSLETHAWRLALDQSQ